MLVTAAVSLPVLWMGYGTDLDIGDVLATATQIRDLDYTPSRNPGVPVVEAIVAVVDPIGGHILVNLATAAAMAATVVGIARLVRVWGHRNGDLVALAFLASPIVVVAGTQYMVAGCAFPPPPAANGPCVSGTFITPAVRVLANGLPVLINASPSLCAPTGTPLIPAVVQARVIAT